MSKTLFITLVYWLDILSTIVFIDFMFIAVHHSTYSFPRSFSFSYLKAEVSFHLNNNRTWWFSHSKKKKSWRGSPNLPHSQFIFFSITFPTFLCFYLDDHFLGKSKSLLAVGETPYFFCPLEQFFSHLSSSSIHIIDGPLCFMSCLRVYIFPFSLYLHFCVIPLCLGIAVIKYIFSRLKKKRKKGKFF